LLILLESDFVGDESRELGDKGGGTREGWRKAVAAGMDVKDKRSNEDATSRSILVNVC